MDETEAARRVGIEVRALRARHGWSQERLAERAGTHANCIGRVERGEANTSLYGLVRIAAALGVPPARLFDEPPRYDLGRHEAAKDRATGCG